MATSLERADATVYVEELPGGVNRIRVVPGGGRSFMPIRTCETRYPVDLIAKILDLKGPQYLCDEILRDESPDYVQKVLSWSMLAYRGEEEFRNAKLLDFGCGGGASTMILARMLPDTEIVGVELEERLLSIARLRADHYAYPNVTLRVSPDPNSLPPDIGMFDYVVLNAVYEHLLPGERETVLPAIWGLLKPGGILFLCETPYRYFPIETHTTSGLPFINYLPDSMAWFYARHFSKRKLASRSWQELLRMGIRGGSPGQILRILNRHGRTAVLLKPCRYEMRDAIDLWRAQAGKVVCPAIKRLFLLSLKTLRALTGLVLVPNISLAVQKTGQ